MTGTAGERARGAAASLSRVWGRLASDQRLAAIAALALLASMLLPWYRETIVNGALRRNAHGLNAFAVYSFVEAAIFVVSLGVLGLLWARAERKAFHLPGGDGSVIMGAGLWTMFLIFYRQFDRPDRSSVIGISVDVSVNWGIFIAFLLGALLAYAGFRIRAAHRPEPVADDVVPGEPPPAPAPPAGPPADPDQTIVARGRPRPRVPADPDGQLSFDEPSEYRPPPR